MAELMLKKIEACLRFGFHREQFILVSKAGHYGVRVSDSGTELCFW